MTRYNFAKSIAKVFNIDESLVQLTEIDNRKAKRPLNTTLLCHKLENDFNIKFRNVKDSLYFIKSQLDS
jgi:dTDP-4-dehydrorhamnose reductase